MNLDLYKQKLIEQTAENFSWEDDDDESGKLTHLKTNVSLQQYDDDIAIGIEYYNDGFLIVNCVFDALKDSEDNLKLVNYLNENMLYFAAFIVSGDKYLKFRFCDDTVDEDDAVNRTLNVINYLFSDELIQYLKPLTIITK